MFPGLPAACPLLPSAQPPRSSPARPMPAHLQAAYGTYSYKWVFTRKAQTCLTTEPCGFADGCTCDSGKTCFGSGVAARCKVSALVGGRCCATGALLSLVQATGVTGIELGVIQRQARSGCATGASRACCPQPLRFHPADAMPHWRPHRRLRL